MKELAIVYLVAGISSRFGGKIKQFAVVGSNGETLIEYSMNQAIKAGFNKIIFIVGNSTEKPFKEKFKDSYKGIEIKYAHQLYNPRERDKPWGTCDAICSAKNLINGAFVVCNGDDLYGEKSFQTLYNHLQDSEEDAMVVWKLKDVLPDEGTVSRGIAKEREGYLADINEVRQISKNNLPEKITENSLCNMNLIAMHKNTLNLLKENLDKFKNENKESRNAECYLPVEIANLVKNNKIRMKAYNSDEKWMGVTNPEDEDKVKKMLI
jgi:NDP-sugar pyrophosphorylase family protein